MSARFRDVQLLEPEQIEDELVRHGARSARLTAPDVVALLVAARTRAEAAAEARALLDKAGVTCLEVGEDAAACPGPQPGQALPGRSR